MRDAAERGARVAALRTGLPLSTRRSGQLERDCRHALERFRFRGQRVASLAPLRRAWRLRARALSGRAEGRLDRGRVGRVGRVGLVGDRCRGSRGGGVAVPARATPNSSAGARQRRPVGEKEARARARVAHRLRLALLAPPARLGVALRDAGCAGADEQHRLAVLAQAVRVDRRGVALEELAREHELLFAHLDAGRDRDRRLELADGRDRAHAQRGPVTGIVAEGFDPQRDSMRGSAPASSAGRARARVAAGAAEAIAGTLGADDAGSMGVRLARARSACTRRG